MIDLVNFGGQKYRLHAENGGFEMGPNKIWLKWYTRSFFFFFFFFGGGGGGGGGAKPWRIPTASQRGSDHPPPPPLAGKTFPAVPEHAEPAILRIWKRPMHALKPHNYKTKVITQWKMTAQSRQHNQKQTNMFAIRSVNISYESRMLVLTLRGPDTQKCTMMTSSNGNIFRVTGHLCREFTGPGEFPTQRPVTRSFDVFDLRLNKRLSKQPWGWLFETPSGSLSRHSNDTVDPFYWHGLV